MSRKIANRSKLAFVKIFLKHWIASHLHEPNQSSKRYRFKNFLALMKQDGEYLTVEPNYEQCYNFFRDLNPRKWKSKKKKKELQSLKTKLSDIFEAKKLNSHKYLLQSDLKHQYTSKDKYKGAQLQLNNINAQKHQISCPTKNHNEIAKELDQIYEDDKQLSNLIKAEIKKKLLLQYYGS